MKRRLNSPECSATLLSKRLKKNDYLEETNIAEQDETFDELLRIFDNSNINLDYETSYLNDLNEVLNNQSDNSNAPALQESVFEFLDSPYQQRAIQIAEVVLPQTPSSEPPVYTEMLPPQPQAENNTNMEILPLPQIIVAKAIQPPQSNVSSSLNNTVYSENLNNYSQQNQEIVAWFPKTINSEEICPLTEINELGIDENYKSYRVPIKKDTLLPVNNNYYAQLLKHVFTPTEKTKTFNFLSNFFGMQTEIRSSNVNLEFFQNNNIQFMFFENKKKNFSKVQIIEIVLAQFIPTASTLDIYPEYLSKSCIISLKQNYTYIITTSDESNFVTISF